MPNSLKCKIKHLCHNRTITESECDRILKALEQEPKTDTWSIKDVADTLAKHGLIAEQEPCEDCISRQAVLDIIEKEEFKGDAISEIEKLPSVNPQKIGWIPVSERLPEDRKEKLVYLSSNRITIAKYSSRIIPLTPYKSMGWGYESRYHFIDFETEEVIAWMPLPEPYKAESEYE